ncbi:unnamed protein product [Cladocopium goreaui]|uniref:Exportin(tRNA) n=1 Tax=Cladocopium goreaui TaxID=2562237 RepID=A0A9P1BPD4_9DINO|nr:unnamed protein product [Cladocopium goreaui]
MAKWKQFLPCPDVQSKAISAHKPCLEKLRNAWREALVQVKAKKKSAHVGEDALQVIEKTLEGATCCFGNHIFAFKQASFTLLQLLRLLPEPSEDFSRLIVQLLVQLAKQDRHGVLTHFVGDCEAALDALRHRPLKINGFQRLNQLCKERLAAEAIFSEKAAGLAWDLGSVDRLCRASERLVKICGCLEMAMDAASMEALQMSLLRLATAATSWEDSTQLLTGSLESLAKLRSKDSSMSSLSICLQHEFAASVVSLLRAGLKSDSPALRNSASQLAIDALQIEETLLWPHLPALVSTVFECEAPQHLLTAVARLGSKLQPALEQSDARWLQLVVDPSRCRPLLHLLPCLDLTSAPVSVQRLKKIVLGEVTAARAALADQKPSMEVVLEAIKLNGGLEMQVEGEKFIIHILEEVRRGGKGTLRSWHRLLLCLEAFTEVKHMGKLRISFWQKLLESATGPGRLAVWTALARWLQRLPSVCQKEPICGMQIVLQELGKDAQHCSDTSLLVSLCYVLVLCFSPCLLDGNVGDIKKLPNIEA